MKMLAFRMVITHPLLSLSLSLPYLHPIIITPISYTTNTITRPHILFEINRQLDINFNISLAFSYTNHVLLFSKNLLLLFFFKNIPISKQEVRHSLGTLNLNHWGNGKSTHRKTKKLFELSLDTKTCYYSAS